MSAPDFEGPPIVILHKARSKIIARQRRYKGSDYLDIREFVAGKTPEGIATRKGITIPISLADDIVALGRALVAFEPQSTPDEPLTGA